MLKYRIQKFLQQSIAILNDCQRTRPDRHEKANASPTIHQRAPEETRYAHFESATFVRTCARIAPDYIRKLTNHNALVTTAAPWNHSQLHVPFSMKSDGDPSHPKAVAAASPTLSGTSAPRATGDVQPSLRVPILQTFPVPQRKFDLPRSQPLPQQGHRGLVMMMMMMTSDMARSAAACSNI